jgi:hypothetical protein
MPTAPESRGTSSNGFKRILLAALVWPTANVLLILILLGLPTSGRPVGKLIGSLLFSTLVAALIAWLIARRRSWWPWWRLALLVLPFFLVLRLLGT